MTWVLLAVAVVLLVIIGVLIARQQQSRRLKDEFGPEYGRVVAERGDQRSEEQLLARRLRRLDEVEIRPLERAARECNVEGWGIVQRSFAETQGSEADARTAPATSRTGERAATASPEAAGTPEPRSPGGEAPRAEDAPPTPEAENLATQPSSVWGESSTREQQLTDEPSESFRLRVEGSDPPCSRSSRARGRIGCQPDAAARRRPRTGAGTTRDTLRLRSSISRPKNFDSRGVMDRFSNVCGLRSERRLRPCPRRPQRTIIDKPGVLS
jgi:hypothetical protein